MATFPIRGRIVHGVPSPTGIAEPCVGASIQVYDLDEGGNGNDLIYTGVTDARGEFSGQSSNWKDLNTKTVNTPVGGHWEKRTGPFGIPFQAWVADFADQMVSIPDALILKIVVAQGINKVELPFVSIPEPLPLTPTPVPWQAIYVIGKVNGTEYYTGADIQRAILLAANEDTSEIAIELYGEFAAAFQLLLQERDAILATVRQHLGLPQTFPAQGLLIEAGTVVVVASAAELVAIATIILALAAAIFAVGMAISVVIVATAVFVGVIMALAFGYACIDVEQTGEVNTSSGSQQGTRLKLRKGFPCPP